MNKTEQIIERLANQSPILSNPAEFAELVMQQLPERDEHTSAPTLPADRHWHLLIAMRNVSSVAAIFLIALMLWQQWEPDTANPAAPAATAHTETLQNNTLSDKGDRDAILQAQMRHLALNEERKAFRRNILQNL